MYHRSRGAAVVVLALLAVSALALASAPLVLPESYSWVAHTTSQGAGQGVPGAWLPRIGFVAFGSAVLLLDFRVPVSWGAAGRVLHAFFGTLMIGAAAFSSRAWAADAPFDRTEDLLHSIAASAMGVAFAFGVVSVAVHRMRTRQERRVRLLDLAAVAASVVIPLGMFGFEQIAGLLQRVMFATAYLWYAAEAISSMIPDADDRAPVLGGSREIPCR